ncbi:MAG: hypothetical protein Q4G08_09895 [Capnocytophaga sp.]|nr:hypothetical protein [Capnocytophaga sp.]
MKQFCVAGICSLLFSGVLVAQNASDFKKRFNEEVRGDIVVIGNSILNREESRDKPNTPYDDVSSKAKLNDHFTMKYIDVDNNQNTYSSSSATLRIVSDKGFSLKYAGLYWAATYPYASGARNGNKGIEITDKNRNNPASVLLKLPSQNQYTPVSGTIIFDGFYAFNNVDFKGADPYVAYADVTELVKNQSSIQGEYFVGNVNAAVGDVAGGAAAGWILVFIYEENGASPKRITTFDGFSAQSINLNFGEFTIPASNSPKARFIGAALDGDRNITGDKIVGHFPQGNSTFFLMEKNRDKDDFFNSSITRNNDIVTARNPSAKNTLGFDLYDIDFSTYHALPVGDKALQMKIIPASDKVFSFFNALAIETTNAATAAVASNSSRPPEKMENTDVAEALEKQGVTTTISDNEVRNLQINNADPGYYNIVGVYYNSESVIRLIDALNKKGYEANYLFDDKTYYHYIYTHYSESFEEALKIRGELLKDASAKGSWILAVGK